MSEPLERLVPPALRPGDTIAFCSPSTPITVHTPKRLQRAREYVRGRGYNVREGSLTGCTDFYRSGSAAARADELNTLLRDPDVRCVMSTIGGQNSNALLPYIDYDAVRSDPKIIVGYSDVTAILLGLHAQTGLITFYGPAFVASLGEFPPIVDETFDAFTAVVGADAIGGPLRLSPPHGWTDEYIPWEEQERPKALRDNRWQTVQPGQARGRLVGGNLSTMTGIWGSPYMPLIGEGDILLIEDALKDIAVVERLFVFLRLNGVFDRVGAVLLGKHEQFDDAGSGRRPADVLLEVLDGCPVPVLAEFDCCHTHPMLTLPIGAELEVNTADPSVVIHGPCLR
ncbi:MAG: LD-carboxypeptidase [Myxococcales bacterium FL481]|nr:MAG: LD-carboxypeptidase [Myxococcales bacterium FL481]